MDEKEKKRTTVKIENPYTLEADIENFMWQILDKINLRLENGEGF